MTVPDFSGHAEDGSTTSAMHRRLGQEDVLHDEMFELGDAGPGVIEVGVGHGRVLAHDVHAPDFAGVRRVDDLDHGEAGLRRQRRLPQLLVFLVDLGRS